MQTMTEKRTGCQRSKMRKTLLKQTVLVNKNKKDIAHS